mmetsp:Transcript_25143/g.83888  ORF Transcript_25143/g.83888 Transcript_25143/m.83888 type:complete len:242 (-) Transcript_25143:274-999(-)
MVDVLLRVLVQPRSRGRVLRQKPALLDQRQLGGATCRRQRYRQVIRQLAVRVALVEGNPAVRHENAEQDMAPRVCPHLRRGLDDAADHPEVPRAELLIEGPAAPEPHIDPSSVAGDEFIKPRGVRAHALQLPRGVGGLPEGKHLMSDGLEVVVEHLRQGELPATVPVAPYGFRRQPRVVPLRRHDRLHGVRRQTRMSLRDRPHIIRVALHAVEVARLWPPGLRSAIVARVGLRYLAIGLRQ